MAMEMSLQMKIHDIISIERDANGEFTIDVIRSTQIAHISDEWVFSIYRRTRYEVEDFLMCAINDYAFIDAAIHDGDTRVRVSMSSV